MPPRPPSCDSTQVATPVMYGDSRAAIDSGPPATIASHSADTLGPTNGMLATQSGGLGSVIVTSFRSVSRWACSTSVDTSMTSGAMTITSSSSIITSTAPVRLPPQRACAPFMSGQVATTIIAAQMSAGRNGFRM